MTLYVGNQLIRYTKNSGILYGNQPIAKVYKGIQLVYEVLSYDYGETVYEGTGQGAYEIMLGKGVYNIYIAGGGGNSGIGFAPIGGSTIIPWSAGGGSGAAWEGQFYNPIKQSFKLYTGGNVTTSYMELGGVRMITAGNGGSSYQGWGYANGAGGSITVSSNFNNNIITTTLSKNGNPGSNGSTTGGSSVSSLGWGKGQNGSGTTQAGGAKLVFVRPDR